ncbi:MAG: ComEC/Rec2 family competence protein [Ignavibacteria bacterium]|nr:ComEC/Rec2 family competence protein [Ignavibacteria bacterium]
MEKININSLPTVKFLIFILPSLLLGLLFQKETIFWSMIICGLVGFTFYFFKKLNFAYIFFSMGIGFIVSINFKDYQSVNSTTKFTDFKAKVFGEITDVSTFDSTFYRIRVIGEINNPQIHNFRTNIMLSIFDHEKKLKKIGVGDKILCIAYLRLPRKSNLPTDPAEVQFALSQEVNFFGKTNSKKIIRIWENKNKFENLLANIRERTYQNLSILFSEKNIPLYNALLLGNKSLLENEQREKFATTGISHILALSGFHFGILATIVFFAFSFIKNNWFKFFFVTLALLFYLAIVNFPPSGIRATVMIITFLYSYTLERKISIYNTLGLILVIIILFAPNYLFSIGFQLSFFAVLGIVLFYNQYFCFISNFFNSKNKILSYFIAILSTTLAAQTFTAPLVALYFGYYTFISFFSNILLLPLFTLAISYGFVGLLVSFISIEIAKFFSNSSEFFINIAVAINDFLANNLEFLTINEEGTIFLSIVVSALIIWLLKKQPKKLFILKLAFSIIFVALLLHNLSSPTRNEIHIFPRKKYVALVLQDDLKNRNICFLFDRKPSQMPTNDIPMLKYLASMKGELVFGVTGNAGIQITDQIKRIRKVRIIELPSEIQRKISLAIFGDLSLFKK